MKKFFRTGYEERVRRKKLWRKYQQLQQEKKEQLKQQKLLAQELSLHQSFFGGNKKVNLSEIDFSALQESKSAVSSSKVLEEILVIDKSFSAEDFERAFSKLTEAAMKYDKALPG